MEEHEEQQPQQQLQPPFQDTLKLTLKSRIEQLKVKYTFALKYSQNIITILKLFTSVFNEKVLNTLNENKNVLKFFKELTNVYQSFSDQIKKAKIILKDQPNAPGIFDDGLKPILENSQTMLTTTFLEFSSNLKSKIIAKGPLSQGEGLSNNILKIQKTLYTIISKIENRRKKLEKHYKNKYELLFNIIVPEQVENKEQKQIKDYSLDEIQDFVLIEIDLSNMINKLYMKISLFLLQMKDHVYQVNLDIIDYSKLMREAVKIYLEESRKMYKPDILRQFSEVEKYYEKMNQPGYDITFKISKLFHTEELLNNINSLLKSHQTLLRDSGYVSHEILTMESKFNINSYSNIELFFEMLISINPKPAAINYNEFVKEVISIKRDPGVFSSWRKCQMMISKQNHIIIFDEPISSKNAINIFEIKKVIIRKKDGKKHQCLFEIVVNKKTKIMHSSGTFTYDALNEETLKKIFDVLGIKDAKVQIQNQQQQQQQQEQQPKENELINEMKENEEQENQNEQQVDKEEIQENKE